MIINTKDIIVLNWFDRKDLNSILGVRMDEKEFLQFKRYLDEGNICDEISELVKEHYCKYSEELAG